MNIAKITQFEKDDTPSSRSEGAKKMWERRRAKKLENKEEEKKVDWTQFAILAITFVGLFVWNRSESRSDIRQIENHIKSIQEEMKDFHGRLERQDAEFKGRMEKIDIEFKGILAKQDAEFKSFVMYGYKKPRETSEIMETLRGKKE